MIEQLVRDLLGDALDIEDAERGDGRQSCNHSPHLPDDPLAVALPAPVFDRLTGTLALVDRQAGFVALRTKVDTVVRLDRLRSIVRSERHFLPLAVACQVGHLRRLIRSVYDDAHVKPPSHRWCLRCWNIRAGSDAPAAARFPRPC